MKFRHNNLTYDTGQMGAEQTEAVARKAAFNRDVGMETLKILGFEPDHTFEPREAKPELKPSKSGELEHKGYTIEH